MTHDFKPKKNQPKASKSSRGQRKSTAARRAPAPQKAPFPKGLLVVALMLISSFAYGLYYLSTHSRSVDNEDSLQSVVKQATKTAPDKTASIEEKNSTQFEFYSLLPKQAPVLSSDPAQRPHSNQPARNYHYMLQAGAFKKKDDAERRRAELILNGYEAQLEPTKYSNGKTWYRLLIGPFNSQSKLAKVRSDLLQSNIETLVIKRNN